jgi:class 3 adenylate cyclase
MSATTQHGYLLIADISGYTSFVARTELEHSHEILSDLLGVVCEHMEALLTFHKLEGDAVFAYAPEVKIPRGETLLELIESTYVAFRDKQVSMKRATTCTCNACLNIPSLDLKFIAHHGEYILQQIRDIREMIGSDVNLVHRLLKNNVTEATGWRAYMLFTEPCLEHMHINLEDAHQQMESYEHLAEVRTYSLDLHKRYHEIVETRRVMLDKDEADVILTLDFNVPPPVAWDWMQSPTKRNLWGRGVQWSGGDRPRGRTGSGASNHCAHGKGVSTEIVLDWRPFEYSTTESYNGGKKVMTDTLRFEALPGGGTRVHDLMKFEMPLPRPLRRIAARLMTKMMKMEEMGQKAARLAAEEYKRNKETDES